MSTTRLRNLEKRLISATEGPLSRQVAEQLVQSARDGKRITRDESYELLAILHRHTDRWTSDAPAVLHAAISVPAPRPAAGLEVQTGRSVRSLQDDKVLLFPVVEQQGNTEQQGFSRGYVALSDGVLRARNGSEAPATPLFGKAAQKGVARTAGGSLDAMAKMFGFAGKSFEALASSEQFFKPEAEFWEGMCHAWARLALSAELSAAVEVEGPEGQRGIWLGGQWLSRADLGNWLMALGDQVTQDLSDERVYDAELTPQELLSAVGQMLKPGQTGFLADIVNDAYQGQREVWNQPFTGYSLQATALTANEAAPFLRLASGDGALGATQVQFVQLTLQYMDEEDNGHEEAASHSTRTLGMYVVTNPEGKMVGGYHAGDSRLAPMKQVGSRYERAVAGLSYEVPEHLVQPKLGMVTAAKQGLPNRALDRNALGPEFRFFVGTVLGKGVPGERRAAFEEAFRGSGVTPSAADIRRLVRDFPGVANAYSPAQWAEKFGRKGLSSADFGAAWV